MVLSLNTPVTSAIRRWSIASQQQARRNAMVASTALVRRRIELDEVADFLAFRRGELAALTPDPRVLRHG